MTRHEEVGAGTVVDTVSATVGGAPALDLRVQAIRYEAATIRSVELRHPQGAALPPVEPGAHLDLALPGGVVRSYSLINGPGERDRYVIAVHRDPASRGGSAYICETLRVGDRLAVALPRNTFPLAGGDAPSLLVAGGIGVTPILSMIRHLEARGAPWSLAYAIRDRAAGAFLDDLAALEAAGPGRVTLHLDAKAGGVLPLAPVVAAAPEGAHLYCCGPAPMIDAFLAATATRAPDHVHVERFAAADVRAPTHGFTVVLRRKGLELQVPAGRTIMEVLQEASVRVPYSCREGVCGTCETRVLEGEPDHRDNVLSARERASNKVIMICCSGAKGDRLVLDI